MKNRLEQVVTRKKLIEVSLPLEVINIASAKEKGNPFLKGHSRSIHQWWARRPLAAARAVLFAQLVDDPSSRPELFPTEEAKAQERQRLFRIIEEMVQWENTTNETVLESAREEIRRSWRRTCEDNKDHPRAAELFNPEKLPAFHDPFAGGGSIPLEAQRLGLEAHASDLNPVAVLINKAMIEIPPKFAGNPPVNPEARQGKGSTNAVWKGAAGLAEDVRYYGKWMRDEAEKRIGHLYPKIEVTAEMVRERPDLKPYLGRKLTVIAWLWAHTVKSPNPAFVDVDVPLACTFILSCKKSREAYVEPVFVGDGYRFTVKAGTPPETSKNGTTAGKRGAFLCLMSGVPVTYDHIRSEGKAGGLGARMMAIVAEGDRGRVYLSSTPDHVRASDTAKPCVVPNTPLEGKVAVNVPGYGINTFADLFTDRQLVALTTFSDLVGEARECVRRDAVASGMPDNGTPLRDGGAGATSYSEAVGVFLAFAISKQADYGNTICTWNPTNQNVGHLFTRQAIPMAWDFPEASPIEGGLAYSAISNGIAECIELLPSPLNTAAAGRAFQEDYAGNQPVGFSSILSTDPPYYDNISYADLSDFFYVWLRRSLRTVFPDLFTTLSTPKDRELVATPYRLGDKKKAEAFFLDGMTRAMQRLAEQTHPAFPVTVYYAFKQSENKSDVGIYSTGWESFLEAAITAGFLISGTWPMRTERGARAVAIGANALASSVILVCRPRPTHAPTATRREFIDTLRSELPEALRKMQAGNIAPVDLAQASIGPGMAVFTRYAQVLDASAAPVTVQEALSLINQTLDEVLADQEGAFDADTRWALAWFEQSGFDPGDFGVAETLSKAKNTSVAGMVEAGILRSGAGKVSLLRPDELSAEWNPDGDSRRTAWESVHHLVGILNQESEGAAAALLSKLGSDAETVRDLAYRLYRICDQKNRPQEALGYNALVRSWGEISELAQRATVETQASMFDQE